MTVTLLAPIVAYALPAALMTMLPGPDTAMILTTALKAGPAAAVRATWGVGTGLLLWGAAAALGLAAALRSSAVVYELFRWCCAAYLLALAVHALRAARRTPVIRPATASTKRRRRLPTLSWGYRRALLTCALNPKLGVFFVVFLPHFIPAGSPVAELCFTLAAVQAVEAVLWYLLLGRLAHSASRTLNRPRVRRGLDHLTAVVFLGFGLRVATETTH
jgi:threonine/homoserine/homoserine lactone efflux protein